MEDQDSEKGRENERKPTSDPDPEQDQERKIKGRMNQRLSQLRWSLVDLADATGESYRNVHRWVREEVKVPAHFVTRFAEAVPVDSRWLLTGAGTADPVEDSTAKKALQQIAHVLDSVRLTASTGVLAESVIESSVDGILAFDTDCRYTLWNPAMEEMTGVSAMAVLGKVAFDVFPFLEEIGEDEYFRKTLAGEKPVVRDRRYSIPESGRTGWFEGHYSPLRDAAGEIVGGLCVVRDVTEQKDRVEKLEESEERYRRLLQMNPDPVLVQVDDEIIYANRALEELLNCPEDDGLVGRSIEELVPDAEWDWRRSVIRDIEEGARTGPLDRTLVRCDGSRVDVVVRAVGVTMDGKSGTQAVIRRRDTG